MSETIRLRNEDSDVSPYRSLCEPLLYYDGHIQLDIPIRVDGVTVQACNIECIVVYIVRKLVCIRIRCFLSKNAHKRVRIAHVPQSSPKQPQSGPDDENIPNSLTATAVFVVFCHAVSHYELTMITFTVGNCY